MRVTVRFVKSLQEFVRIWLIIRYDTLVLISQILIIGLV